MVSANEVIQRLLIDNYRWIFFSIYAYLFLLDCLSHCLWPAQWNGMPMWRTYPIMNLCTICLANRKPFMRCISNELSSIQTSSYWFHSGFVIDDVHSMTTSVSIMFVCILIINPKWIEKRINLISFMKNIVIVEVQSLFIWILYPSAWCVYFNASKEILYRTMIRMYIFTGNVFDFIIYVYTHYRMFIDILLFNLSFLSRETTSGL